MWPKHSYEYFDFRGSNKCMGNDKVSWEKSGILSLSCNLLVGCQVITMSDRTQENDSKNLFNSKYL